MASDDFNFNARLVSVQSESECQRWALYAWAWAAFLARAES
jgi:hypothetical protein